LVHQTQSDSESDAALLARYASLRDEQAFAELMRRHGPMVLAVSSRMLRQRHDAEDVLQAVFLTLASRARGLRRVRSVAGWLHNVAVRISLNWLKMNRRREAGLRKLQQDRSEPQPNEPHELRDLLDEELAQLPARLKETLILRDLEGYSRSEVARKLGVPPGTVDSRLSYGRKRLRERLVRRGVTVGAGGLAAALAECAAATAVLPAGLTKETIRLAELFLLGTSVSGVPAITTITSLAQGELNSMFLKKLSTTVGVLALATVLALGASPVSNVIGLGSIARADTIIFDDFNDGNAMDGRPWTWRPWTEGGQGQGDGTFDASTGDFVLTPQASNTLVALLEPAMNVPNLSVRMQLRNSGDLDGTVSGTGVLVRGDTTPPGIAIDCGITPDGILYINNQGPYEELGDVPTALRPLQEDVVLQADVFGTLIRLFAWRPGESKPQQPQLQATSNHRINGTIGIYYNPPDSGGAGTFRYVHVADMPIPEPSSFVLGSLGAVALASFAFCNRLHRIRSAR
jgi:RNA polymerase sigma factor (sigma-70 family)